MNIRTFVSVHVPSLPGIDGILSELGKIGGIKVTPANQVHITLSFIGDIDERKIPAVVKCVEDASAGIGPGMITLTGIGAFPDVRKPRVVWTGISSDVNLAGISEKLAANLSKQGIDHDDKPFKPHMTVGRCPDGADISKIAVKHKDTVFGTFACDSIRVMKSELKPSGAVHTVLHAVKLH